MPSFEPSYYQQKLHFLDDEFENVAMAKSHFNEHWQVLRRQWNDQAGQRVDQRHVIPMLDYYDNFLRISQQHSAAKQQIQQSLNQLQQQLFETANKHEELNRLSQTSNEQQQQSRANSQQAEQLDESLDELNLAIKRQIELANSHTSPL